MRASFAILSLCATLATTVSSEELKPGAWVPLPAIGSTPETGFQYGAYVMRIFEQTAWDQPQNRLEFLVQGTTNGQYQAYIWPDIWLGNGQIRISGQLGGRYWPADYFGQGESTQVIGDKYSDTAFEGSMTVSTKLSPQVSIGGRVFSANHSIENIADDSGDSLLTDTVTGVEGGQYNGVGFKAEWDDRDNIDWPSKGSLVALYADAFTSFLASDYDFTSVTLKAAQYASLGSDTVAFGSQLTGNSQNTPFTHLARSAGDKTLRGANGNRWIDLYGLSLQGEYRKVISPRWAAVAFVDTFQAGGALTDLTFSDVHFSTGVGIRFGMTPDRFNIRFDLGWVDAESVNFAISVGEAF